MTGSPPAPSPTLLECAHRPSTDRLASQESLQVGGQLTRRGVSASRFLGHGLQADRLQVPIHRRIQPPRRHWFVAENLEDGIHRRGRLERGPARHQGIQRRPQRVNVRGRPHLTPLAAGLLRRHVTGRTHDLARAGQPAVALHLLREAEVRHAGIPVFVQKDIRRLQIAVNHSLPVCIFDRVGDLCQKRCCLARRQRASGETLGEALPLDQAHREVMLPLVLADLIDRHDRRMIEVGRRLGLDIEAANRILISELAGQDHFEGDLPVEAHLTRLEYNPHAAAGQLADDLIIAEVMDDDWRWGGGFARRIRGEVDRGLAARRPSWLVVHGWGGFAPSGDFWLARGNGRSFGNGRRGFFGGGGCAGLSFLGQPQFMRESLKLGQKRGPGFLGDIAVIIPDTRLAALPPIGLEVQAHRVDLANQIYAEMAEVVAMSVAHRGWVRGPDSLVLGG